MDDFKPTHKYTGLATFICITLDLAGRGREVQMMRTYSDGTALVKAKSGQTFTVSEVNLEKLEEKEMKFTNENIAKGGWIVGSFQHGNLSFSANPKIHNTEAQAKAEALRLAQIHARKFVWLQIGGGVSCREVVWEG